IIGPAQVPIGQSLSCVLVVRNHGPAAVAGVRVELPLPPGARALATEPAGEARNEQITWQLGNLEAGGERRLRATLQPGTAGEVETVRLETVASAPGKQVNEVVAWADYADGRIEARGETITQIVQSSLALRLDGPRVGGLNDELDFRLTLDVPADTSAGDVHL